MNTAVVERRQVAGHDVHSIALAPFRVHRVADIERVAWPVAALFRDLTGAALAAVARRAPGLIDEAEGRLDLAFNSYVVETPETLVLVDAGVGNDKERPDRPLWHRRSGRFLEALAALGFAPERFGLVINTHLHADHVGWNTVKTAEGWSPTFPNARYVAPAREIALWRAIHAREGSHTLHGAYDDSVAPLLAAGRLEGVETPVEIVPGLRLEPAHGHSPGMAVVRLTGAAGDMLFTADVIHHPLQLGDPAIVSNFCEDPAMARATRSRLLDEAAGRGTLIAPYHFPAPVFGRIARAGQGYAFQALEGLDRLN